MRSATIIQALILVLVIAGTASADSMQFTEKLPAEIEINRYETGDTVEISGFGLQGDIGAPLMPEKSVFIALPPNVDKHSVSVKVDSYTIRSVAGRYNIIPAPPIACSDGMSWEGKTNIHNGKDLDIYLQNAFFPTKIVELESVEQMRKWIFARIKISPALYNPVTEEYQLVEDLQYSVSYSVNTSSASSPDPELMADTSFDVMAEGMFSNYESMKDSYQSNNQDYIYQRTGETYCIITTDTIKSGSTRLAEFIKLKEDLGFKVKVITEADYGTDDGQQRSINIREWLKNNYIKENITYVLLIGNPNPDSPSSSSDSYGDVPMMMCWARRGSSYAEVPTDVFYSDLTGDWDLDGDGFYGEYDGDKGTGGVEFAPEVITGRIPVYSDSDLRELDSILYKTIIYQSVKLPIPAWRKKVLMAAAFSNFANENRNGSSETDKATLTEAMIDNFYDNRGFSNFKLYEKAGVKPSSYACDIELTRDNVCDEWKKGYGIASLNGHGSSTGIYRKYWKKDDGDNVPESGELTTTTFFNSTRVADLDDNMPSITINCACNNGYPETTNNLGYEMLFQGSITTFTASRVSWYWVGWSGPSQGCCNQNVTYYYNYKLSEKISNSSGYAAAWMRTYLDSNANYKWMNKMDFNIYGDPSVSLLENVNNDQPIVYSENLRTEEEVPISVDLRVVDSFHEELTLEITTQPEHGQVVVNGFNVTYIPDKDFSGVDVIGCRVKDDFLVSREANIKILVNNQPIAFDSFESLDEDTSKIIDVEYYDPNKNPVTLNVLKTTEHGTLVGTIRNLKYTPDPDYFGIDSFTFVVNDGFDNSNVATVEIAVLPKNDVPILGSFTVDIRGFKKHIIPLDVIDIDSDEFLVVINEKPVYGTVEIDGLNLIYTPVYRQMTADSLKITVFDKDEASTGEVLVDIRMFATPMGCSMTDNDSDYSMLMIIVMLLTIGALRIRKR